MQTVPRTIIETVARLQTPPGRGGIAVIELLGPRAGAILAEVFRPMKSHHGSSAGALRLGYLISAGEAIDQVIVTGGADRVEINIHGGPHVAQAALTLLKEQGAAVAPAEPAGIEAFSRPHPHWDNPAIAAEMLEALPLARSELTASAVTHQWSGGISKLAHRAISTLADCDAGYEITRQIAADILVAAESLTTMNRLLHPAEVVLVGPPNAGKSTLANAMVGRTVSIVHERRGTTRDWVREIAILGGVPIYLTDTAGLWDAEENIDAEAVRRARDRSRHADVVLALSAGEPAGDPSWLGGRNVIHVSAKCDIHPPKNEAPLAVSALTGYGLERLEAAIRDALGLADVDPSAAMALSRRQADLLNLASAQLGAKDTHGAGDTLRRLLSGVSG